MPQELAQVLQRVVCPAGLGASELAMKLEDLGCFTQLACVQVRMQGPQPLDCARAIASVVREAVSRLGDGPSRQAVELLLGVGTTWGLLRKDRRKAASEVLVVGESHFRKRRELGLLAEVAEQVCALEAAHGVQDPQPRLPEQAPDSIEPDPQQHDAARETIATGVPEPSRTHRRPWLLKAGGATVALLTIVSAVIILIRETSDPGPAAGTNGQQISYCPKEVSAHGTAKVSGANQEGIVILNHSVSLSGSCGLEAGWWWARNVDIAWYDSRGGYVGATTCYVPQKQKSRDWVYCDAPH